MAGERPNILVIMSDEHAPMFSGTYGHPLVQTPSMDRLVRQGTTFQNGYCNAPLCVPSRLSFMTGRFVSHCRGWDNSTPLYVGSATWPWLLKSLGYDTALNGKMHMVGPNPLNGFDVQLTHDPHAELVHEIYRWKDGVPDAPAPWPDVPRAGPGRSPVIDHDDAVEAAAHAYLQDRGRAQRPWALVCGFISPHFPLIVPEPFFSMYYPDRVDLPNNPAGHLENLPPAARRLQRFTGTGVPYPEDQVLRARAAYFGMITFLDEKIGRILDTLERTGMAENTIILHTSDHGELAGEHGLWRKMSFYEQSSRIPLQISWPGRLPAGRRDDAIVSNVDMVATLMDAVGIDPRTWHMDGDSLLPRLSDRSPDWKDEVFCEHLAHGTDGPQAMVRQGKWKLSYTHRNPPDFELYDLDEDPGEFTNLAGRPEVRSIQDRLFKRILEIWGDPDRLAATVMESQEDRYLLREVTGASGHPLL